MGLDLVRYVDLPKMADPGATLTFIEGGRHIPFKIRRVYYLYNIRPGEKRGGHAHKLHQELILPLAGSFDIILDDGYRSGRFHMDQPSRGILFPTMVWHELENFSEGAVCLVHASLLYDAADYYRQYDTFKAASHGD